MAEQVTYSNRHPDEISDYRQAVIGKEYWYAHDLDDRGEPSPIKGSLSGVRGFGSASWFDFAGGSGEYSSIFTSKEGAEHHIIETLKARWADNG